MKRGIELQERNPFNPTFGNVPPIFLDKQKVIDELIDEIQNGYPQPFFVTGVRGSGKTSFLTRISQILNEDPNCYCVDLINEEGILTSLARKLYRDHGSKLSKIFNVFESIKIGAVTLTKETEIPNVEEMLEELMQSIQKQGKYVVITIDEVNDSKAIRSFAQQYNSLKRQNYPIYAIMTGLPDLVLDLQNNERLTFLLRSRKIVMQPLDNLDMENAYQDVFNGNFEVAHQMAGLTNGYSYAFQLLGDIYFRYLKRQQLSPSLDNLNAIFNQYEITLFNNAYQKIFAGVSEGDRKYLVAILNHPQLSASAQVMGKGVSYVSQYRKRMIDRGLVQPSTYGKVRYTLPLFDKFIEQTQNPNSEFFWEINY